MHILVVEDDQSLAEPLINFLTRHGHDVLGVTTGSRGLDTYQRADLVLLDLDLRDMDGLEVCRNMRAAGDTPIIAFTEQGTESDRILGLQAGSDDCLPKPYGFRELMARIDAVMRRMRPRSSMNEEPIMHGALQINAVTREVWLGDELVEVTRKEFDLLYCLALRPGVVLSRSQLLSEIWGYATADTTGTKASRTIDTHVSTLRGKLGSNGWIRTVRGIGFRFEQEGRQERTALRT